MSNEQPIKPWGGRFQEPTDAFVERFTQSVSFDQRLYHHDINGSIAHATMLAKVGVLSGDERDAIVAGLEQIRGEAERGEFDWAVSLEDVHMNIEARLTERIGIAGKKLHTGRSRNDQVATDVRLYLRDEIDAISAELTRLQHLRMRQGAGDVGLPQAAIEGDAGRVALDELAHRLGEQRGPGFGLLVELVGRRHDGRTRRPDGRRHRSWRIAGAEICDSIEHP